MENGLVLPVAVRFKSWLSGRPVAADAFVDPGADRTLFSLRWIAEHASGPLDCPDYSFGHVLREDALSLEIERRLLKVPTGPGGARLARQGPAPLGWEKSSCWEYAPEMAGLEDILIGRDFLRAHDLMLLADFGERWFSLLHPADLDNVRRRERVVAVFDPSSPLDPPDRS